jgi:serine protease Do
MAVSPHASTNIHTNRPGAAARFAFAALAVCALAAFFAPSLAPLHAAETPAESDEDPDIEFAARLERAFEKIALRVGPSVVNLQVVVKSRGAWPDELKKMSDPHQMMVPERQFEGSGVIVDSSGFIVTNEHVVRGAETIRVKMNDGRAFSAEVTGTDPRSDLAIIKLSGEIPKDLVAAKFADSDAVKVGQWTLAVGNPFGLNNTVTVGLVSARGRSMPVYNLTSDVFYGNLIQTDAAINPGNSGGPLFDIHGRLIGINTMIFSKSGFSEGFGFAIPSNHLQKRVAYLKTGREIEYGWLGVRLDDLKPGQTEFGVPGNKGVVVESVIPHTPADRAGLQQGMVIVKFNGVDVATSQELIREVNETPVGHTVSLQAFNRDGKLSDYTVKISKRNADIVRASALGQLDEDSAELVDILSKESAKNTYAWRGLRVKELSDEDAKKRGGKLEIVSVQKGSPADLAGMYEGAIVTEIKHDGAAISKLESADDFQRETTEIKGSASLYLTLDGFVSIPEK